jgi:hypothetical protein
MRSLPMKRKTGPRPASYLLAAAASAVLSLAGLGGAATTNAQPVAPPPTYHWCPGDNWDPAWGLNWEWARCHDDFRRDIDGYQYLGPPPPGAPPLPWYPPNPDGPPFWYRP